MTAPLLMAEDVRKSFTLPRRGWLEPRRVLRAVDGVSLQVERGETLGLVGESGCGKSTLGRCLVRLYDIDGGRLALDGIEIGRMGRRRLRPLRRRMQMVFQDPAASLNPRRRVRDALAEPLRIHGHDNGHGRGSERSTQDRVAELIRMVGLAPEHLDRWPHEFSGGQRQRVGIARALALEPELLVADEPVSALDVSIQAQIVNLLADLRERLALTLVFISHDLGVVRQISSRIAVMYLGRIVEIGAADAVLERPLHPYTEALLAAVPRRTPGRRRPVVPLSGDPPSPIDPPPGCRFHTRCQHVQPRCRMEDPALSGDPRSHAVACHFPLG